jgi:hypothetical protein
MFRPYIVGVVLQEDVSLKAYACKAMFQLFRKHVAGASDDVAGGVFTNVTATILYMFQQ